jgi:hypothetical protein
MLRLNNKNISLREMQAKGAAVYRQPLELYSYAREVVQLLKQKQYAATWREYHGEAELLLAISLDWKRVKCMRTVKGESVLLEWARGEEVCGVRAVGEKAVKKSIG